MKRATLVTLVALVLAVAASICIHRGAATAQDEAQTITVTGKIQYMKNLGGYFFMGEDPPGAFIIVNKNTTLLKRLMKTNETITIDGHLTLGADYLFIEKVNGKKYRGKS
jgi:hypothetical protein